MSTNLQSATSVRRPQLLKVPEVAQLLNVKPRTIYEMVAQHRIPYRKPPGTNILRFDLEDHVVEIAGRRRMRDGVEHLKAALRQLRVEKLGEP